MKKYWTGLVIAAFISIISFFQIGSYWADTHNFNGGWTIIGIAFGLAALFCLYKVRQNSNTGTPPAP